MRVLQRKADLGEGVGELRKPEARVQALNLVCYLSVCREDVAM